MDRSPPPRTFSTRRLRRAATEVLSHERFPLACFALAAMVRLVWIAVVQAMPLSDFGWYFDQGRHIAAGQGYAINTDGFPLWDAGNPLPEPRPTAFWPVGYPAFLGALFFVTGPVVPHLWAAKLANVLLYLAIMAIVARSAAIIFQSKLAGRATLLVLAFLPNHVAYTSLTSVEIFFLFLSSLGILLVLLAKERGSWAILAVAGVVFGLATHTKPQAVILPLVLLTALEWKRPRRLGADLAAAYLTLVLTLVPWTVRNYQAFGRPVFMSNNGGINLLIGNMPGSWGANGLMWNRELHEIIRSETDEIERDRAARKVALRYIAENPVSIAVSLPKKFVALYTADVDGFGWNGSAVPAFGNSAAYLPLRIFSQVYYGVILLSALGCVYWRRKSGLPYFWVGPVIFLYFSGIYMIFFGGARFHFPVIPWLAAYAAGLAAHYLVAERSREPIAVAAA